MQRSNVKFTKKVFTLTKHPNVQAKTKIVSYRTTPFCPLVTGQCQPY
nr:MAG TPA: Platypus intermediate defensin-like peptide [Caudoviricetes sp.]